MRVIRLALVNAATLWRRFVGLAVLTSLGVGACLSALTLSGVPGSMTLTSTSRSPLETYRELSP